MNSTIVYQVNMRKQHFTDKITKGQKFPKTFGGAYQLLNLLKKIPKLQIQIIAQILYHLNSH